MSKGDGPRRGGQGTPRPDGDYHFTLWRADPDGGRGERLSWDQGSPPRNLHHTDQESGRHSSDPKDFRTGEQMLGGCFVLMVVLPAVLLLAAVLLVVIL